MECLVCQELGPEVDKTNEAPSSKEPTYLERNQKLNKETSQWDHFSSEEQR